ncbi:MAG: hypothetical protein OHK0039_09940 [Bacteroidia bacterium]
MIPAMNRFLRLALPTVVCLAAWPALRANHLRWAQLSMPDAQTLAVSVAWDHSWSLAAAPGNHDAVWLFIKARSGNGPWLHLAPAADPAAHSVGDTLLALHPAPGGLILRRTRPGEGDIPFTSLLIRLASPLPAGWELQLHGIEMAYVPPGPYWLGDSSSSHSLRDGTTGGPYYVGDSGSLTAGPLGLADDGTLPPAADVPATYPTGYAGFYCMKYELSQAQYAAFLNTLDIPQQTARTQASPYAAAGTYALTPTGLAAGRNGIVVTRPAGNQPAHYACNANGNLVFDEPDDGGWRACNYLDWEDLLAYLDWAALRPMTELEFEKACRGPVRPLPGGFAWGTAQAVDANTLLHDGTTSETAGEVATTQAGLASHGYAGPQGPLRSGFGARDTASRLQSGASYYGICELSGNLWELCVQVDALGLGYDGRHGDGAPDADGRADVPRWPRDGGAGFRGGAWNSGILPGFRDLAVSDRFYIDLYPGQRRATSGGRGVLSW